MITTLERRIPGFNRQVTLFMLYSAIYQMGMFGITDAVLNFYFVSLGYETNTIGFLQAVPRIGGLITGVPLALLADRIGVRRITIWSMIGAGLTYFTLFAFPSLEMLATSRFLHGVFYGAAYVVATPLMMMLVERRHQTHLFAYYNLITMGATAVRSFVGGQLPTWIVGAAQNGAGAQSPFAYGMALVIAGILVFISIPPLLRLAELRPAEARPTGTTRAPIPWLKLTRLSLPFLSFGFTGGLTFPFYNLFFRQTFDISDQLVGTILSLGWFGMALITLANPWLDRRWGRVHALGMTMTIGALAFAALSLAPGLAFSVVAFVIAISVRNTMTPLFQPLMMENIPPWLHNSASSVGFILWSLGWFVASSVSGHWQSQYGYGFIMQVVAVGVFLTGVCIVLIFRRRTAPVLTSQ